jgi:hypothetical protein
MSAMNDDPHNETLRAWVQSRQCLRAPEDLADRLLPRLAQATPGPSGAGWRRVLMFARAAVFILAVAGGLSRYAVILACLFGS